MNEITNLPIDEEQPEEIIDEIIDILDDLHKDYAQAVTSLGEDKEQIESIRPIWVEMANNDTQDERIADLYHSGTQALSAYRDEIRELKYKSKPITNNFLMLDTASSTTVAIAVATNTFFANRKTDYKITPITLPRNERSEKTFEILKKLDLALAATYNGIREALYGTRSDPERAALYETRQLFDHLFSILAPDYLVRSSKWWHKKDGNDPEKVTRDERLRYAANKCIGNPVKSRSLIASSRHMLRMYDILNRAHTRGELNIEQAKEALREIDFLIQEWALSIDLNNINN